MWPFNYCIGRINNTQVDDAHDIDVIMSTSSLIEYSNDYSETSKTWMSNIAEMKQLSMLAMVILLI